MFHRLCLGVLLAASLPASAQSSAGPLGGTTWVLCGTTREGGRDALVFEATGDGRVIRAQGNLSFRYRYQGNRIALSTPAARQPVLLDVDGDLLVLRAPDGQPAARYARQGSAAMARCTVQ